MTIESFNESVNAEIRRMTAQQGEPPTSFSAWLEANKDSIEPLDRTEATAQWFDEKREHENDLRWESLQADESEYGPPCNEPGFPYK